MRPVYDWTPSTLKKINRGLALDSDEVYDFQSQVRNPAGATLQTIANKKPAVIRVLLQADTNDYPETEEGYRDWWVNWMSVAAGRQLWPDGNHRTALLVATQVANAMGWAFEVSPEVAESIRIGSKALIQQRWSRKPPPTVTEWLDADNALNRFYASFRDAFQLVA